MNTLNPLNTLPEKIPTVYAGLDIAKATLQLHLQNVQHVLANHPAGHAALLKKIRALPGVQIVCEATGGYEKGIVAALHAAAQPVSVLNPALVRHFALAQGQRAKNDPLDAEVLTAYGLALQPEPTPPREPARDELRALVQWRDHLKEQLMRTRQTVAHGVPAFVARQQKKLAAHLEKQLAAVKKECQAALARTPQIREQVRQLEQLDAVGTVTALSVLSHLPELGPLNRQAAAALARMKETTLGKFYAHLRAAGKPAKVALTAVMRKLLLQMNRVLKEHALQAQAKTKMQPA